MVLVPQSAGMDPIDLEREHLIAAMRGGDASQPTDGEDEPRTASIEQAVFWSGIYSEIVAVEEETVERIEALMAKESAGLRQEVELTNEPIVAPQVERFRQRLCFWQARLRDLQ